MSLWFLAFLCGLTLSRCNPDTHDAWSNPVCRRSLIYAVKEAVCSVWRQVEQHLIGLHKTVSVHKCIVHYSETARVWNFLRPAPLGILVVFWNPGRCWMALVLECHSTALFIPYVQVNKWFSQSLFVAVTHKKAELGKLEKSSLSMEVCEKRFYSKLFWSISSGQLIAIYDTN